MAAAELQSNALCFCKISNGSSILMSVVCLLFVVADAAIVLGTAEPASTPAQCRLWPGHVRFIMDCPGVAAELCQFMKVTSGNSCPSSEADALVAAGVPCQDRREVDSALNGDQYYLQNKDGKILCRWTISRTPDIPQQPCEVSSVDIEEACRSSHSSSGTVSPGVNASRDAILGLNSATPSTAPVSPSTKQAAMPSNFTTIATTGGMRSQSPLSVQQITTFDSSSSKPQQKSPPTKITIALSGAFGGVIILVAIIALAHLLRRDRRQTDDPGKVCPDDWSADDAEAPGRSTVPPLSPTLSDAGVLKFLDTLSQSINNETLCQDLARQLPTSQPNFVEAYQRNHPDERSNFQVISQKVMVCWYKQAGQRNESRDDRFRFLHKVFKDKLHRADLAKKCVDLWKEYVCRSHN